MLTYWTLLHNLFFGLLWAKNEISDRSSGRPVLVYDTNPMYTSSSHPKIIIWLSVLPSLPSVQLRLMPSPPLPYSNHHHYRPTPKKSLAFRELYKNYYTTASQNEQEAYIFELPKGNKLNNVPLGRSSTRPQPEDHKTLQNNYCNTRLSYNIINIYW